MSPDRFNLVMGVAIALDALVAGAALWLVREKAAQRAVITLPRLMMAVIAAGLIFVIKSRVLVDLGIDVFGLIYAAYIDLVIVVPLIAMAMLVIERSWRGGEPNPRFRLTRAVRAVSVLSMILMPLAGIYATHIEPFRLKLEQATVPVSAHRAGAETIRIGVLADLQTSNVSDHERNAVARLMAESPDIILIPGDLLQAGSENYEQQLAAVREILGTLHAPGGVYFAPGDCEAFGDGRDLVHGLPIVHLHNKIARFKLRDRSIAIGGLELDCKSHEALQTIKRLENDPTEDEIRILMSHRPDSALALTPHSRIDLIVAGHTHGGQVQIPFIGPLITFSKVPRSIAAGGLHEMNGNLMYVSRGLGWEHGQAPRIRFLCPPEISMLTLTAN